MSGFSAHCRSDRIEVFFLLLLNPAGNAGIGSYRAAITPDHLQGRVGSAIGFVSMGVLPFAPVLGGFALATLGGTGAITLLVAGTAVGALVPTLSRSIRAVPRPADWPRLQDDHPVPATVETIHPGGADLRVAGSELARTP